MTATSGTFADALPLIAKAFAEVLRVPDTVTPTDWARQYLVVPDGPYAGQPFTPELTPYLVEPLDGFANDDPCNKIIIKKSAQTGFTLLAIAAIGHMIDCEPCRTMLVQPTGSALTDFNREKLQPAIDGSGPLAKKVRPQTSRSGRGSTTYSKKYPGGSLTLAIATSTADLRGKTVRKVIKDEASEYPEDLDGQGSPHQMIAARYESFQATQDFKEMSISTPVIKGACYIDAEFETGDQRYWHVPCPHCGSEFVFTFGPCFKFKTEHPHDAHYVPPCCNTRIDHDLKNILVRRGRWIATAPAPGKHRSYHFDALSSPFVPWDLIAARFIDAKDDPTKLKAFDNLTLGRAHEVRGDAPDHERLMALREHYPRRRIPAEGLLLVAAADVQANGIYVEVLAFGADCQSWVVEALVLDGDTDDHTAGAWKKLDAVYETKFADAFGNMRRIDAFGVDSGFRSNTVYSWCRERPATFALKGGDGWARPALSTPKLVDVDVLGKTVKEGASLWTVGTWSLKAQLYALLRKPRVAEGAPDEPIGCAHFADWLEVHYFIQLTNEYLIDERHKGRLRRTWKERGPNHWLDCRIYNMALADYLGVTRMTRAEWKQLAQMRGVPLVGTAVAPAAPRRPAEAKAEPVAAPAPEPVAAPPAPPPSRPRSATPPPRTRRSSFMDGY